MPNGLKIMKLVEKLRKQEKSEIILVKSFTGRGESCDLIFLFGTGQIDRN